MGLILLMRKKWNVNSVKELWLFYFPEIVGCWEKILWDSTEEINSFQKHEEGKLPSKVSMSGKCARMW